MALPTLADAKAVLRLQGTTDDAFVTQLLARAQALVETYVGVRITAATDTVTDWTTDMVRAYGDITMLSLSRYPVASAGLTVTDVNAATVDPTTYVLVGTQGLIRAKAGTTFNAGPYTIAGTIGLSAHPDYATRLEAVISTAILDIVADLYDRRAPGTVSESDGGGFSQVNTQAVIPPRVQMSLAPLRLFVVA
jgi:uncharacterized phiE125 gp8 family phage protein